MSPLIIFLIYIFLKFVLSFAALLGCGESENCQLYTTVAVNILLTIGFGAWFYMNDCQ